MIFQSQKNREDALKRFLFIPSKECVVFNAKYLTLVGRIFGKNRFEAYWDRFNPVQTCQLSIFCQDLPHFIPSYFSCFLECPILDETSALRLLVLRG